MFVIENDVFFEIWIVYGYCIWNGVFCECCIMVIKNILMLIGGVWNV